MDLIDRLRPKWRHPDPAVRAAAVRELAGDEQERLAALATGDPDPGVRRLAIEKVEDTALLERVAASDGDEVARGVASERLREVLIGIACSGRPLAECEAALARLSGARSLAAVVVRAEHAGVRHAALAGISGDRVLRDLVRTAPDPGIRSAAVDRIHDAGMLRGIAVGDGPLELALRAVERIDDVPTLDAIAGTRTAAKAVRQRARASLASRSGEHPVVGAKEARARQQELSNAVHMLRVSPDPIRAAELVEEAMREWEVLARQLAPKPEVAESFTTGCDAILQDAGSLARRRAAAEHARIAVEESITARAALCERIEAIDGADTPRLLAEARATWSRLAPVPDEDGVPLWRRFSLACERAAARHQEWCAEQARRATLEHVVEEAEALAETSPPPPPKVWKDLERRWGAVERGVRSAEELERLEGRLAAARERLRRRWQEGEERRAEVERQNLARLDALWTRLRETAASETLRPSAGRRELQAAEAALGELGPLPASERRAVWAERLSEARDELLRRVAQAEQTEEWRRWANVGAQEEIIARVEALLEANDLAEGTRQLTRLQEEWATVATASPEKSQALWDRFRTARNELRRRCDVYLADNLEKKRALCVEVAAVGDSTTWNETADLIRRVQAEWKAIGPVPGKHARVVWQQFREPCDRFFARRKEHFDRVDAERSENARQKIALCGQAEALADSTDWDATATAIKQLQAEWKRSGPPPRKEADALWERFRTACDRFFDRRSRRHELAREEAMRKAQALCDDLDAVAASLDETGSATDGVGAKIDEAWGEWVRLELPPSDARTALGERVRTACARIAAGHPESLRGTRLDPEATRKRREKLCARLEALVGSESEAPRPTSLQEMALALRDRLATNTIAGGTGRDAGRKQDVVREVERIVASWEHLGPPLDDDARALGERFERARTRARAKPT